MSCSGRSKHGCPTGGAWRRIPTPYECNKARDADESCDRYPTIGARPDVLDTSHRHCVRISHENEPSPCLHRQSIIDESALRGVKCGADALPLGQCGIEGLEERRGVIVANRPETADDDSRARGEERARQTHDPLAT